MVPGGLTISKHDWDTILTEMGCSGLDFASLQSLINLTNFVPFSDLFTNLTVRSLDMVSYYLMEPGETFVR